MAKEYAKSFYKSRAWQKCRDGYISSVNGLCEECLSKGAYRPGYIVHHIEHITPSNINDPRITLNFDNLQYVCLECHNRIHYGGAGATAHGLEFDGDGNIVPVRGDATK